jgi:hypothetical protein
VVGVVSPQILARGSSRHPWLTVAIRLEDVATRPDAIDLPQASRSVGLHDVRKGA